MRGLFVAGWQNTSTFCIRRSIFDVSFLKELKATPNTERRMSNFEVVVPLSDFRPRLLLSSTADLVLDPARALVAFLIQVPRHDRSSAVLAYAAMMRFQELRILYHIIAIHEEQCVVRGKQTFNGEFCRRKALGIGLKCSDFRSLARRLVQKDNLVTSILPQILDLDLDLLLSLRHCYHPMRFDLALIIMVCDDRWNDSCPLRP